MSLNVFAYLGRQRFVLLFFLGCLMLGAARARTDSIAITAGALALDGSQGAQIGLTEHQIRQLIKADASVRDALLAKMVSGIRADLRRQNRSAQLIPEQMLRERLLFLLNRSVPPEDWEEQLAYLVAVHDALWRHLSSLTAQRIGVEDRLIRAAAAQASGEVKEAAALLDAELLGSEAAASAAPQQRLAADLALSSLLAARGLMAALLGDGDAAKRQMLKSAALRESGTAERAEILLQAGSASAAAGSTQGLLEVARVIHSEATTVLSRRPSDAVWRHAQWVAQLVIGVDAVARGNFPTAKEALTLATQLAPGLSDSQPVHWSGIWGSHYLLAAIQQQEGGPEALTQQTEALRLSKEMSSRRPDWPKAWIFRALSGSLAVREPVDPSAREADLAHLQDAMSSLDRVASLGSDSSSALEVRLQVLAKLQNVRLEQGEVALVRELSQRLSFVAEELKRRLAGNADAELDRLMLWVKPHQATVFRRTGMQDQAMAALLEAVALVDRVDEGGRPIVALSVHTALADTAFSAGQFPLAAQQWRLAVQKAEVLVGLDGPRSIWQEHLWQGLLFLAKSLGKQFLAEEAIRTNERAYEVARRRAAEEPGYGTWHHRQFDTLMESVDLHRQRGTAIMSRYEAAARIPGAMYGSSELAGRAAEDLWTVRTEMGDERLKRDEQELARALHGEALQIAERALQVKASSDEWLGRAASSHAQLAEIAGASQEKRLEVTHWQAALDLSARRSPASRDSSDEELERWLRLFNLANAQLAVELNDKSLETMSVARDLARRFAAQLPNDRYWLDYLWFSESGIGDILARRGEVAAAETAYGASIAMAESMIAKGQNLETWWDHAASSLEAQAEVRKQLGRDLDARQAEIRASGYRLKLHEVQRAAEIRAKVKEQMGGVLDALELKEEQANALAKADLMFRLQAAIDRITEASKATDMDNEKSERLRRLRNTLFVVRQLPD